MGGPSAPLLPLLLLMWGASSTTAWNGESNVAAEPPRGWTSWNTAGCRRLSQNYVASTVDALAASPLLRLGFNRVGIDDCWQSCGEGVNGSFHSADGAPLVNRTEFPDMHALVQRGVEKKIAVGFYVNNCNCAENKFSDPGFIASVYSSTVAYVSELGFGGLKLDSCSQFRDTHLWAATAAKQTPDIMVEDCHNKGGPTVLNHTTGELDCPMHIWRTGNDITPGSWDSFLLNFAQLSAFLSSEDILSRPNCWAYPDACQTGSFRTFEEDRSNFGAWCVSSSPLILGTIKLISPVI